MKALFGLLVMGCLVGAGSAGVYYAQQHRAKTAAVETTTDVASADARDLNPAPIPLPARDEQAPEAPGAGNPFAGTPAPTDDAVADRYRTEDVPVDDAASRYQTAESSDVPSEEPAAVEPAGGDIPDADQIAGGSTRMVVPVENTELVEDPSTAPPRRFPEQQAAAEVVEPEPAADPGQPAEPAPADEPGQLPTETRPGNPLRAQAPSADIPQPGADRYATEPTPPGPTAAPDPRYATPESPAAGPLAGAAFGEGGDATGAEGSGRPGDASLAGTQAPSLTIEKTAPPEIQIGKPALFVIKVKNAGSATAHGVEIHDSIPKGTQLLDTNPPAKRDAEGNLVWELGSLKPGDEQTAELQLMPTSEGEIGSVATVHFRAEASVRTTATRPLLQLEVLGPSKVNKGEQWKLHITLSNPGSGAATGVTLTENVPQGLKHEEGKELELEIGTLKPGESRELDLALVAAEPGMVTNVITAAGDGKLQAEARTEVEVVAPQLQVAMTGPKRRYLERNATHNISISNPGTAPAKDVDLVAVLPRNLKFVEANNGGQFDAATHAVYWSLEELPPKETGTVTLTTLPLEPGEARVLIKSSSKTGLKDEREEVVAIEGLAAINFQLADVKDPIEVGGETSYEIKVTNQGTKAATNVRLAAIVPRGLKAVSAEGPVRYRIEGPHVVFEPLKQLAAKGDTIYKIKVQAIGAGDQRIEIQVATDEIRDPISKQESTRVYGDE
jgi:uncharacterized repeat protein (TIGR01451 family)